MINYASILYDEQIGDYMVLIIQNSNPILFRLSEFQKISTQIKKLEKKIKKEK